MARLELETHAVGVDLGQAGQGGRGVAVHRLALHVDGGLVAAADAEAGVQQARLHEAVLQLHQDDVLRRHPKVAALQPRERFKSYMQSYDSAV